ncbi:tRNA (adenosine(37)-N6)-threonylcarbamoyltransferase complex ATPase subunit type 1 TsaE [Bacteroidia bacterium]|nr:tRNA (adenosine(37)-N6)-threonylcarbamoyltransferase complex ATPase subunit type 1 TsaE [Bacteroidia bacterium]GHV45650.1 tRNA (adenosine(37)-N6)-threonylcarbamoyltransferase complex ATPase subunit type 1 TsaE [Bacteroidia bacterium]
MLFKNVKIEALPKIAADVIESFPNERIFAFFGTMGVGKTTFIKCFCDVLGVKNTVNSPTFSIINEYTDKLGELVYHFDFYRMKNRQEIADLGYEEYFYSGSYCFLEWSELVEDLLPDNSLRIEIRAIDESTREIEVKK